MPVPPAGPADPERARGEYARTKAHGELIALAADSPEFPVLVLRPHLMWGPGDTQLTERIIDRARAGRMPVLGTGAGHDAGILAAHGIPTSMIFVRNPTGVSHSPAEHAERDDCLAGVEALARAERLHQSFLNLHPRAGGSEPSWEPPMDVIETEQEILILVALPGVDPDQVEAAVARIADRLGAPTVLVNNAGIIRDNLIFKMSVADWDAVMAVHLRGAFLMTRACQTHMTAERYGRIVNLSSTSAQGNRGQVNYSAAKAGLQGFTKTLAIELGKFGVTANAIAPGFIVTDMTAATAERVG